MAEGRRRRHAWRLGGAALVGARGSRARPATGSATVISGGTRGRQVRMDAGLLPVGATAALVLLAAPARARRVASDLRRSPRGARGPEFPRESRMSGRAFGDAAKCSDDHLRNIPKLRRDLHPHACAESKIEQATIILRKRCGKRRTFREASSRLAPPLQHLARRHDVVHVFCVSSPVGSFWQGQDKGNERGCESAPEFAWAGRIDQRAIHQPVECQAPRPAHVAPRASAQLVWSHPIFHPPQQLVAADDSEVLVDVGRVGVRRALPQGGEPVVASSFARPDPVGGERRRRRSRRGQSPSPLPPRSGRRTLRADRGCPRACRAAVRA